MSENTGGEKGLWALNLKQVLLLGDTDLKVILTGVSCIGKQQVKSV